MRNGEGKAGGQVAWRTTLLLGDQDLKLSSVMRSFKRSLELEIATACEIFAGWKAERGWLTFL